MSESKGHWVTIKGTPVYIEDGQTLEEAFAARKKAMDSLGVGQSESDRPESHAKNVDRAKKAHGLMRSGALPKGVEGKEYLGGTMDVSGNPVDMRKFKDGYLVSCGNASTDSNVRFLLSDEGADFIAEFLANSDDGELYVGSWFEDGKNTNEPTTWVKDLEKAKRLAKATGQYAITDCAAYNKYGCRNYELLGDMQLMRADEIFIPTCENEKEHAVDLRRVKL